MSVKLLFRCLSYPNKLSILIYHQVLSEFDPMRPITPIAGQFEQHMNWIKSRFNVLTLSQAVDLLREGDLPPRSLVITFDDGYADNYSVALPVLLKHDLKATFFISSDFIDDGMMWNDRIIEEVRVRGVKKEELDFLDIDSSLLVEEDKKETLASSILKQVKHLPTRERSEFVDRFCSSSKAKKRLMMTKDEIRELVNEGMEIGGHTCSHPILANLDRKDIFSEVKENKSILEQIIDQEISSFAYPNGKPNADYNMDAIEAVKESGYKQAVTTSAGVSDAGTDLYQIPRYTPWRQSPIGFGFQLANNYLNRGDFI
ncbi:MAG: polysaccharide deacetylase family protein [Motiliproteus sp.]|nr:polysaccharide deacetylase family protein [Motiliproteus sp.]